MVEWIAGKIEYTEEEAAYALGLAVSELRSMIRTHVIKDEPADTPLPVFKPTDLLLLQALSELHPVTAQMV
jgi:hypothetical protein